MDGNVKKNKFGRLIEVYPSLFIIEYTNDNSLPGEPANTYVESYTYSDILTEKKFNSLFGLISCFYRLN